MLCSAHVEVYLAPVRVGLGAHQCIVVVRIHISKVIGRRACEARHGVEFEREHRLVVNARVVGHRARLGVPGPACGVAQRRLARLGGQERGHLGQLQRQAVFRYHVWHAVFVVHRERLAPVALPREDGIAQAVVHFYAAQALLLDKRLGLCNGLLHGEPVEHEAPTGLTSCARRVANDALLGIEALLADVASLYQRPYLEAEVLGKGIVARVVGRHGHDGPRAVSGQHIVAHPYWYLLAGERVDGIRAGEHAADAAVGYAFALGALLRPLKVSIHLGFLPGRGQHGHELALGCQHHESDAEHRVGAGGEDGKRKPLSISPPWGEGLVSLCD